MAAACGLRELKQIITRSELDDVSPLSCCRSCRAIEPESDSSMANSRNWVSFSGAKKLSMAA